MVRLTVHARVGVVDEQSLGGCRSACEFLEDVVSRAVRRGVFGVQLIAVAFQHEFRTDADVQTVVEVEGDFQTALQIIVHEIVKRVVADDDDGEQISHERVADRHGQFALAHEKRRHLLLEGEVGVKLGRLLVRRGDSLCGGAAHLDILIDGVGEQVVNETLQHIRDLGHGHGELGQTEEGQIQIEHLVEVMRRKPTHFRAGLGGEVVQLDLHFGGGQIEHIQHEGEVQTQVRRGVALAGVRDLHDKVAEITEETFQHLSEVDVALGDGKLDLHCAAHRDHGVIEREQRHVVVVLAVRRGRFHLGVDAVLVGVGIRAFRARVLGGSFGLALAHIVGKQRAGVAEVQRDAAQRQPHVHRADVRTKREIEFAQFGVRTIDAQIAAVRLAHVAVLAVVGHDKAVTAEFHLRVGVAAVGIDCGVGGNLILIREVGDQHSPVAVQSVEGVTVACEILLAALHLDIAAREIFRGGVSCGLVEVVSQRIRLIEVAVLGFVVELSARIRGGNEVIPLRVGAVCGCEADDAVIRVRYRHILAVCARGRGKDHFVFLGDVYIIISADVHAEGDFEFVEDVRKAAQVGQERGKHHADDALGEHDLHRAVGVDELQHRVADGGGVAVRRSDALRRGERLTAALVGRGLAALFGHRLVASVAHAVAVFVNVLMRALTEFHRIQHETQEVRDIGVVLHHVEDARAVEIEVAAGDVDAREHFIRDVARDVDVQQLQSHFDGVEVGAFYEFRYLLISGLDGGVRKHVEREFAEIRRESETEAHTVIEGGVRLKLKDDVLDVLLQEGAEVITALAVRLEVHLARNGKRHALRAEVRIGQTEFGLDESRHVVHRGGHVHKRASLARTEQDGLRSGNVDDQPRICGDGEIEARVGACGHHEFDAARTADVEADLAVVLVEDEVLEDIAVLARGECHDVAEEVGGQEDVNADAVREDVAARYRGADIVAQHDRAHEGVE